MFTIKVPEGIPQTTWAVILRDVWTRAFHRSGFPCVSVWIVRPSSVVVHDPHQHLADPEARAVLRQQIRKEADPGMADLICLILFGGH